MGSVSLARTSTSIGRSTRSRRVVAGDRRLVRAALVDLVRLHDLGVRVVRVDLGDDLAALLIGVVVVGVVRHPGQDVAPVLDPIDALLRARHPRRPGVDVVDPHPAVDEAQAQLGAGAVERQRLDLVPAAVGPSAHHWVYVAGFVETVNTHPP